MTDAPELLLAHHLKTLRLPTFLREHDKQARICAAEGVDHVRYLARLTELELIDRERRMVERRIKSAKFPAVKSLDSFDFKAIPSLNKMMVLELARCEWPLSDCTQSPAGNNRAPGKCHRTRAIRHRQNPCRPRAGPCGLSKGAAGGLCNSSSIGQRTDGSA